MYLYVVLPPFQILVRLTFFILSLTARFIQKIYINITKFKSFLKILYDEASCNKKKWYFVQIFE